MKVLDSEKNVGIETFFTTSMGVGGKLRLLPEDFVVHEVSNYPPKKEEGYSQNGNRHCPYRQDTGQINKHSIAGKYTKAK